MPGPQLQPGGACHPPGAGALSRHRHDLGWLLPIQPSAGRAAVGLGGLSSCSPPAKATLPALLRALCQGSAPARPRAGLDLQTRRRNWCARARRRCRTWTFSHRCRLHLLARAQPGVSATCRAPSSGRRTHAMHTSMGCPFMCAFCAVVPLYQGRWVARSAELVARRRAARCETTMAWMPSSSPTTTSSWLGEARPRVCRAPARAGRGLVGRGPHRHHGPATATRPWR